MIAFAAAALEQLDAAIDDASGTGTPA